ncbi:MAG: GNAT family N-acetyltransferase [Oscillospiraceae bacterium]|nr:GNAT family N-acetyltransferase [Oscillospiraceae bacterium]
MYKQIRFYEELSMNSHVALHTQFFDGWLLRTADGYTNRANSVGVLYPSTLDITSKIEYCEDFYFNQDQDCVFKLTDGDEDLDKMLERRGYVVKTPTDCMVMDLKKCSFVKPDRKGLKVIITEKPDEEWLDAFFIYEDRRDERIQNTAKQMFDLIKSQALYCRIVNNEKTIACASAVVERGYMLLFNVIVDEQCRGRKYGQMLCEALLSKAIEEGAHTAYLQVVEENQIAMNLYKKLGYKKIYSYWYRIKKK